MSDNLKEKTLNAVKWSAVDRFGQQAIQLIISILLARRLDVNVFGLIAMLAVFNALSFVLIDSGFGQALVRKKSNDPNELSTIFFFNLSVGIFLYLLLFFTAPYIAAYYNEPQLTLIARIVFIAIPFNSLYLIPFVKLGIVLDFKSISKVNILSTAFSGLIAIVLAFANYGVWALAWQMVSYHFFRILFFHYFVKWKPVPVFSMAYIKEHWKFSINLLGTSSLNAIFNNIFTFIFGKFYSATVLGYYYQANKQAETVNFTFISILTGSSYNVFSQIHEDTERLRRILKEFIQKVAVIVIPVGFFLIFSAEDLIVLLIKEKWLPAVPYFQIISAANLIAPLYLLNINALNAKGLSRKTFAIEIFKKAMIVACIFLLVKFGGIAMIAGYAAVCWISYFISMREVKFSLSYYWSNQIKDILPAFGVGLIVGAGCFLITSLNLSHLISLILKSILAVIFYIAVVRILYKDFFYKSLEYVKNFLNRK